MAGDRDRAGDRLLVRTARRGGAGRRSGHGLVRSRSRDAGQRPGGRVGSSTPRGLRRGRGRWHGLRMARRGPGRGQLRGPPGEYRLRSRRRVGRPVRRDDRGLEAVPVQPSAPSGPLPGTGGDRRPADEHVGRTARRGLEHPDVGACAARPTGRRRPRRRLGILGAGPRRPGGGRRAVPTGAPGRSARPRNSGPRSQRDMARPSQYRCGPGSTEPTARRRPSGTYRRGRPGSIGTRSSPFRRTGNGPALSQSCPVTVLPGQRLRRRNRERGSTTARILRGSVAGSAIPRRISWVTTGSRAAAGVSWKSRA